MTAGGEAILDFGDGWQQFKEIFVVLQFLLQVQIPVVADHRLLQILADLTIFLCVYVTRRVSAKK